MIIKVLTHKRKCAEKLFPCVDWDRAEWRYPNPIYEKRETWAIACSVKITGKVTFRAEGSYWVRGRVEWIKDDEPSEFSQCWIMTDWSGNLID